MSEEDNETQQRDELEAVAAIYGDDYTLIDDHERRSSIAITVEQFCINLEVQFSENYPSLSPPRYDLDAHWLRGPQRTRLQGRLDEAYLDHVGECVLYIWAEEVRVFLQELVEENTQTEELIKEFQETDITDSPEVTNNSNIDCPVIVSGENIVDRKSVFQPHLARVTSVDQVPVVLSQLKENKKIATATHNIYAYRISLPGAVMAQDCDDDGESKAGSRMLHLMSVLDVTNVLVIVTRWYGGCHLGPDRFKHINTATRNILEFCGFLDTASGSKDDQSCSNKTDKKKKTTVNKKTKS